MKSRRRFSAIFTTLLFLAVSSLTVLAQDEPAGPPSPATVQSDQSDQYPASPSAQADQSAPTTLPPADTPGQANVDPPGRVARIQYMSGEVSMQPGGVNDWVAASQNRPLTTSDRVWTDKNSKAELSVGNAFFRMSSETSVTLSNVSDNTVQVELDQGVVELTVRHLEPGEIFEVDMPNTAFTVMKAGVYRFDVFPNEDQSWVTVRKGYGEATGKGNAIRIKAGSQVRFKNGNSMQNVAEAAPANDGFDDWAGVRDQRLENSESAKYVSPGVIGAQDLDQYGTWRTVPTYGAIWVPNSVPAGWAPYRYGRWAWIDPWGWTWVDDAPWGFAPFHYGRWVSYGGYWGWSPGPLGYWNPYYAPALVGWIGGPGFGIGFGGAGWGIGINFGWFALGFGEPFYPWYGGWGWRGGYWHAGYWGHGGYCSRGYFNAVNVTNTHITNINNVTSNYYRNNINNTHFANQHVPGAVTAAPHSAFTSGAAINRAGVAVPNSALHNASLVRTASVTPTRQSMLAGSPVATHGTPPSSALNHSVVTRATPPAHPTSSGSAQTGISRTGATANGNTTAHAPNAATGTAAHNVPRPPSAVNNANRTNTGAEQARATTPPNPATHNVPRPPARNDSFARSNTPNGAAPHTTVNTARPTTGTPVVNHGGTTPQSQATVHNVPRPPANYHPSQTPTNATPHTTAPAQHQSAPQGQHQSSPSHENQSKGSGMASNSVPRPPSGYSYHAAPTNASSSYGTNRTSAYGGGSPYSRSGGNYTTGRSAYPSNQGYSANRGYGGAPSYSGHSAAPAVYSAPRSYGGSGGGGHYSGGGGGGHYSGGGGGGHSSGGGGGGHSSGGGGHR
jgi:hypothetical protein